MPDPLIVTRTLTLLQPFYSYAPPPYVSSGGSVQDHKNMILTLLTKGLKPKKAVTLATSILFNVSDILIPYSV